jgi:fatty-acyl-CoA synthase
MPQDAAAGAAVRHDLHHKVWPKRLPYSITPPATSLWHNLAVNALRFPDKPAIVFFDQVLTYAEVMRKAEALAATLHAMGVKPGDRVMLYMQNSPQWVIAHFAILRANAVVVPVNPMNRAEELKHYITDRTRNTPSPRRIWRLSLPKPTHSSRRRTGWPT